MSPTEKQVRAMLGEERRRLGGSIYKEGSQAAYSHRSGGSWNTCRELAFYRLLQHWQAKPNNPLEIFLRLDGEKKDEVARRLYIATNALSKLEKHLGFSQHTVSFVGFTYYSDCKKSVWKFSVSDKWRYSAALVFILLTTMRTKSKTVKAAFSAATRKKTVKAIKKYSVRKVFSEHTLKNKDGGYKNWKMSRGNAYFTYNSLPGVLNKLETKKS